VGLEPPARNRYLSYAPLPELERDATYRLICGLLKIAYNVALLWAFGHMKPPEERMSTERHTLAQCL
jgi:hypothetical protein